MSEFDNNPYAVTNVTDDFDFQHQMSVHVPDYLVASILVTLICQPLGIIAIVFSALAIGAKGAGNYQQAITYAKNARVCLIIFGVCICVAFLCMLAFAILPAILGIDPGNK